MFEIEVVTWQLQAQEIFFSMLSLELLGNNFETTTPNQDISANPEFKGSKQFDLTCLSAKKLQKNDLFHFLNAFDSTIP